jgi:hypothetical protein
MQDLHRFTQIIRASRSTRPRVMGTYADHEGPDYF